MGRPPIGKVAMTSTERSRRYRAGLAAKPAATKTAEPATKPKAEPERDDRSAEKDREIAQLKARIAELESERAQRDARIRELEPALARAREKHKHSESVLDASLATQATHGSGPNAQISKFIRHLGNANQAEATTAAQKLVSGLTASESDRHALAELWEKHCEEHARQHPPKPKPIDWSEVERAIKTFAEGKTKVTINKVFTAVHAQVPEFEQWHGWGDSPRKGRFIRDCLSRLGFAASRSGLTFERAAPAAEAMPPGTEWEPGAPCA
jgi:hypothetical protein